MLKRVLAAAAVLGISTPALACQRDPPDIVGYPSAIFIAGKMMAAASFADVALAEARRPLRPGDSDGFVDSVTFRTIKRLKGASPDRFTLFAPAERRPDFKDSEELLEHVVDEQGRVEPSWGRQETAYPPRSVPGAPPPPPAPCGPGPITPEVGKLYIVFRDATGRALRTAVYHDARPATTFPVVAANYASWTDWWRLGVAQAATKWKPHEAAQPPAALQRRDDVAKLLLRSPLTAREARKLLDGAKAVPFAVQVAAGEFIDETRVPFAFADAKLLDQAVATARANLALSSGPHAARAILSGLQPDDANADHLLYEPGLNLLNAEARLERARKAGEPRIAALEVRGSPASLARLRASPLVAQLLPGFEYAGQPATPPVATRVSFVPLLWGVPNETVRRELEALASR
ncbi:MAG TPA: hypothetical protein VFK58_07585 [Sphingomicrobium sp.]|nr:hypothetical protein [Sphingomicrobium sp.]